MSFFNKLFGALNKLEEMKDALEDVAESLQKTASDETVKTQQTASPASAPVPTPASTPFSASVEPKTYNTDDRYFASLITALNFPGYTISTDVHANTLDSGAHPSCYPISYLFSKESQQKVLNDIGRDRYIKLPKANTNSRGVEITAEALKLLENCDDTRVIDINFIRGKIDYREVYTKWLDAWNDEY